MQLVLRIEHLPAGALEAAGEFHSRHLQAIRAALADGAQSAAVILPPAPHDHAGWRRAAVQGLARAHAPARINFVAGSDDHAVQSAVDWLERSPGITGQLLHIG